MPDVKTNLRALIIEDSELDAELLNIALSQAGYIVESKRVFTASSVRQALETNQWDIIFSDHGMPQFSSVEALQIRNESGLDIPFIILSGTIGEDVAVEAMRAGASDYMIKGKIDRLIPAVKRELQEAKERELRRRTEQELDYFVTSLTHDLRTPLLAEARIFEVLSLEKIGLLNKEQHEFLQELRRSNEFMQYMVNNIMSAYKYKLRQVTLNQEKLDLNGFISDHLDSIEIRTLLEERSQHINLSLPTRPCPVAIDVNELHRVVLNLIKNASSFSPRESYINVSVQTTGEKVKVNIQDEGSGVNQEIIPHLFTPYATSPVKKYRHIGTGLGLYLSKQIVEAHGGNISFENLPHKGARFYFELPLNTSFAND